jgi:hypothetical protein
VALVKLERYLRELYGSWTFFQRHIHSLRLIWLKQEQARQREEVERGRDRSWKLKEIATMIVFGMFGCSGAGLRSGFGGSDIFDCLLIRKFHLLLIFHVTYEYRYCPSKLTQIRPFGRHPPRPVSFLRWYFESVIH